MIFTFNVPTKLTADLEMTLIFTFNGTNTILGGSGEEKIFAITKEGANVQGGPGDDLIVGGQGSDVLLGNADNDFIVSGGGNDRLIGGSGNDGPVGSLGNDTLDGGPGDDTLIGGLGPQHFICGFGGFDTIIGFNSQKGDTKSADCTNATYKSTDRKIQLEIDKICLISEIEGLLKISPKVSKVLEDSLNSLSVQDLVLLQQHLGGKSIGLSL